MLLILHVFVVQGVNIFAYTRQFYGKIHCKVSKKSVYHFVLRRVFFKISSFKENSERNIL